MKSTYFGVLSLVFISLVLACSSTQTVTTESSTDSIYPGWYNASGFESDSSGFTGYATAIDADSTGAILRAEDQARMILETRLGDMTEEIRQDMIEAGSEDAENTDFIIILRTAHAQLGEVASISTSEAESIDNYFRAFAKVEISKEEVQNTLESGFTGHPRYWSGFSSATSFSAFFTE